MALIWADGLTGKKALALAWRDLVSAKAHAAQLQPSQPMEFAAAVQAQTTAQNYYDSLVKEATQTLEQLGRSGQSRAHVLIVGVGKYDSKDISPLTTSVHGARAFAEWTLTRFSKADRPLGSIELLCSPATGQGEWTPSAAAAEKLGYGAAPLPLPDEAATFNNIKEAFKRWLARAGTCADNAAIWYFSGHGLFKSEPLLLPQDAQLPTETQSADNLIAPMTTLSYMQNRQPSVQCFFFDACSETNLELTYNEQQLPGKPLVTPTNAAAINQLDATAYFGSRPGGKAYGPADAPPYFTQELLLCLDQRAGDPMYGGKQVTTGSLSTAIKAAALYRGELENNADMTFLERKFASSFSAQLCELRGPAEVMVLVNCLPKEAMPTAKLYVVEAGESPGKPTYRPKPRASLWCTPVRKGKWKASADFDPPTTFASVPEAFEPVPPVFAVCLKAR
jgi:Caspase domain